MPIPDVDQEDGDQEKVVRDKAYFLWQREGCPDGRAEEHWRQATEENAMDDEERVLAGRYDANIPAMLTKDVPGG